MAEWNPAAIELFQLTLAEQRGIPKHTPLPRSRLPSFRLKLHHFLLPLLTHLTAFVTFSVFLRPRGSRSYFIHETVALSPEIYLKCKTLYILCF